MNVRLNLKDKGPLGDLRSRVEGPLPRALSEYFVKAMRDGAREQFDRQRTLYPTGGYKNWSPTKEFGTREPSEMTLVRTGAYRGAWTGEGTGSRTVIRESDKSVTIGVDPAQFPQVYVLQSGKVFQVTEPMRGYLANNFKVYLRRETTQIVVEPREIALTKTAIGICKKALTEFIATGKVPE